MSVYLQDSMVLLDGGSVATSEDCCCNCCAFLVSAHGEGLFGGEPWSCDLPATLFPFTCCTSGQSVSFIGTPGCTDFFTFLVFGSLLFGSNFPGEWELQLEVGAFGSILGNLNLHDACSGGPLVISGDAFPPTAFDSAFYTGSIEAVHVLC